MDIVDLGVIGAGLSGLTLARGAARAGLSVRLIDKGRGLGGRMATRRADGGLQFDHGAQYLHPTAPEFAAFLKDAERAGALAPWSAAGGALVGMPGMSGLPKYLAKGLDFETDRRAGRLQRENAIWEVYDVDGRLALRSRRLVVAVPAPQASDLFGADHTFSKALSGVATAPCWALMAGFVAEPELPVTRRDRDEDCVITWLAHDGAKPGRGEAAAYVAHAAVKWSQEHLERDTEWVRQALLAALDALATAPLPDTRYLAVHRWRYATTSQPLGTPFLSDDAQQLWCCGDWCLGDNVQSAWASGQATLADILAKG